MTTACAMKATDLYVTTVNVLNPAHHHILWNTIPEVLLYGAIVFNKSLITLTAQLSVLSAWEHIFRVGISNTSRTQGNLTKNISVPNLGLFVRHALDWVSLATFVTSVLPLGKHCLIFVLVSIVSPFTFGYHEETKKNSHVLINMAQLKTM